MKPIRFSPHALEILTLKRTDPAADITALESEIDARVAALYAPQ